MGRGSSKAGGGGGGGGSAAKKQQTPQDYPEAFAPGQDFEKSGDVDHVGRYVTSSLQRQWDSYAEQFGSDPSRSDENKMFKDWDPATDSLYGYFRTTNSFKINEQLYDSKNAGKSLDQIFTRTDRNGNLRDLETVKTLDKVISSHSTPADASYTRFCSADALQATFGLSDTQMGILKNAGSLNQSDMSLLSNNMRGSIGFNAAYSSFSANRSMNAFSNPNNKQSKGFIFERRTSIPKGTKAYAPKRNAQESEVLFGRGMKTKVTGVSVAKDGHIVIHEVFDGYK